MKGSAFPVMRKRVKRLLIPLVRHIAPKHVDLPQSLWRLTCDPNGALLLDGVGLDSLLDHWGSPLYVVDATRLITNAAAFGTAPLGSTLGCEVYCSYKTNPVPGVLRLLHKRSMGAEVVSPYELWLALRLAVPPGSIVYNGPAKSSESLVAAISHEIGLINLNSRTEIAVLCDIARSMAKRPRVGIRVNVTGGWEGQFGESISNGAALRAFEEALATPDLDLVALHAHLGHEIATRDQLDTFLDGLLSFTDTLRRRLRLDLEILDLGGSLACPTVVRHSLRASRMSTTFGCDLLARDPTNVLTIEAYVARIVERVGHHYSQAGQPPPRIFLEPGRALTGNAQMLLCRVVQLRDPDDSGLVWAVLDAGINVADAVRGEYHQLFPLAPRSGASPRIYRLTGPTCSPGDVLYNAWKLPELERGDGLAIMDAGAYFVPYSTSFSYPQPAIVLISPEEGAQLIRRPERFEDIVSRDGSFAT